MDNNTKTWDFNKIALDFVKENSKILCMDFLSKSMFEESEFLKNILVEDNENIKYNLILNQNKSYDINKIYSQLVKGGHFLTEQIGSNDEKYEGIRQNFNLENEYLFIQNASFKIVRYEQFYGSKSHRFYILAKKI